MGAELASVNDFKEHEFLINQLLRQDPEHRQWHVNVEKASQGVCINGTENNAFLKEIENAFLPGKYSTSNKDYIAYT